MPLFQDSPGEPGLLPGSAMVWLLSSTLTTDDERVVAFSVQVGRGKQAILGAADRVGDDPRLLIDFNAGRPLLSVQGRPVGGREGAVVRMHGQEYRIHRRRFRTRLRFEVSVDGRQVQHVREVSRPDSTVRRFGIGRAADLDPINALALLLLEARPDRMGVLGELFR